MTEPSLNLVASFLQVAAAKRDRPFLVEGGESVIVYGDLDELTARLASKLRGSGAEVGDRVVVQVEKSAEAVLLYLATLRAGLVFVPLNTAYTTAEIEYFIGDAAPALVVCRQQSSEDVASIVEKFGHGRVLTLDEDGSGSLMQDLPDEHFPVQQRLGTDLACILYTSGTTGRSKGAMLTHGNLFSNADTLREVWKWSSDDVLIHILPIYHVHGLFVALHGALLVGATVLFHRGFDPDAVIADFSRASMLMGVPTHYNRLMSCRGLGEEVAARMRLFVSGSAPLLAEDHRRFEERTGHRILERYGMTETGMITSNPYDGERIAGTVGFPLPGVEVRIRGEGVVVAAGEPGILEVRGPNVFAGYWRNAEKTAEEFTEDGFFKTGDVAIADADGRISLVGRAKDLIIAGGLNIYPKEIEEAIDAVPGVSESAVIGIPHADLGEAVVAVVATELEAAVGLEEAIQASIRGTLARFKQPRKIVIVNALPRNAMGKVQKAALRAEYANLFTGALGSTFSPRKA